MDGTHIKRSVSKMKREMPTVRCLLSAHPSVGDLPRKAPKCDKPCCQASFNCNLTCGPEGPVIDLRGHSEVTVAGNSKTASPPHIPLPEKMGR